MNGIMFDLDPVLVRLGLLQIRWYGAVFASTLLVAYWVWRWQMLRGGYSRAFADRFLVWGTIATLAGARLGHCLFYEPERFLDDPVSILFFWQGGLASHGAAIALILALVLFARRNRLAILELMDRFAMSAAVGSAGIRLGNFLNSEIVGRATSVPWAVRFIHWDNGAIARHPSQLYEFSMGLLVLLILYLADRRAGKERRPVGLMTGLFLTLYFAGRFTVEFFKEFQTPWGLDWGMTMGQLLSIIPFLAGIAVLGWVYWTRCHPRPDHRLFSTEPAKQAPRPRRCPASKDETW
jgi:phosphatidylglycerol---prolipoprotein diacylglyceryl transferase